MFIDEYFGYPYALFTSYFSSFYETQALRLYISGNNLIP